MRVCVLGAMREREGIEMENDYKSTWVSSWNRKITHLNVDRVSLSNTSRSYKP